MVIHEKSSEYSVSADGGGCQTIHQNNRSEASWSYPVSSDNHHVAIQGMAPLRVAGSQGNVMSTCLILGAYGLIGESICPWLAEAGHRVLRHGRRGTAEISMDIGDKEAVTQLLSLQQVDMVINLIAATNVDQCECNVQSAYRANTGAVESIVTAITAVKEWSPHLIHISTDQVYDGPGPHDENSVAPCNVYALSKLAGEYVATRVGATVLRTNFIGRSRCPERLGLTDWIVDSLRTGERITVFDDVLFSAVHITTLCAAIETAVRQKHAGTFNIGCSNGSSKAQMALTLADRLGLDCSLMVTGSSRDARLTALRPLDMRMNSSRFEKAFGFSVPTFESQIDCTVQEYLHE